MSEVQTSFFDLPEPILITLCSKVACSSLEDVRNLEMVSKSIHTLCNKPYVVKNLPLHQDPLYPNNPNPKTFKIFMNRCVQEGNGEAISRKGLRLYFDQDSTESMREERLGLMAQALDEGNLEARFVYGVILLCLGGVRVSFALLILSPLIKPLLSTTLKEVEALWVKNVYRLWWYLRTYSQIKHLGSIYVRSLCSCDRKIRMYIGPTQWCPYGSEFKVGTGVICQVCLWHHQVHRFFLF